MRTPRALAALAALLLCLLLSAAASFRPQPVHASTPPAFVVDADVTVDFTDLHQTIDGFGAAQPQYYFANIAVQDHAFTQMGLSILRLELQFDFESINDNPDPTTVNLPGFDPSSQAGIIGVAQGAQARGVQTFLATPWTPPAWMKTNNNVVGGSLTPGMEPELAEYFSTYVDRMQAVYGVPITHLCLQNEPNVTPGWWGCSYTPAQMATLVKATGARFALDSRTTQIVVADTSALSQAPTYLSTLMSDPAAAAQVSVLSTHPYDIAWNNPDSAIAGWNSLRGVAQGFGVKLWQTEHSNFNDFSATAGNWNSALLMAQHMHVALTQGDVCAWLYWNLNRQNVLPSDGYGQSLYVDQLPIAKAYAMGQFAKHVRPGAVRCGAASTDANVLVSAYRDNTASKIFLVAINRDVASKVVGISTSGLPLDSTSQGWRSSVSEAHVAVTGVDLSTGVGTVTLPAQSVTTFEVDMLLTKTIRLTAPNGGERYAAGSLQSVQWTSTGGIGTVDVLASYDGGGHYLPIASAVPNSGSYAWMVPAQLLSNVKVKVQETGLPGVNDTSNASFSIVLPPRHRRSGCQVSTEQTNSTLISYILLTGVLAIALRRHGQIA